MTYSDFLKRKEITSSFRGVDASETHPMLFAFQDAVVRWALKLGRACVWADTGLGKTLMQAAWASRVPGDVLIVAPLGVAKQTEKFAKEKMGLDIVYCRNESDRRSKISITNYQMLDHFEPRNYRAVALDEGGILKNFSGAIRNQVIGMFDRVEFKTSWTATPAPNDYMELGSQAEFLGVMSRTEMLSMFFTHDGGDTSQWRLKGHAEIEFWKWVCSWAIMFRKPSDIGYSDEGFILPPMKVSSSIVESKAPKGYRGLTPYQARTLPDRVAARRDSVNERCRRAAEIVNAKPGEPWLIWCNRNDEADIVQDLIEGSVQVRGSDSLEAKMEKLLGFSEDKFKVLITKPSIAGHGMNWQHCSNIIFLGLSDSWEQYYQAVRRCYRFGQKKSVNVYIVISRAEGLVLQNINRKERDADEMFKSLLKNMNELNIKNLKSGQVRTEDKYVQDFAKGANWRWHLGDSVDEIKKLPNDSIHFSIFSPPFASLYTYSASSRDLGNSKSDKEFFEHFEFIARELFRVMKPGRIVAIHLMNLPSFKEKDGMIGLKDFRGDTIKLFTSVGFIHHSEVVIWKDPVIAMQRTKAIGLLWKQLKKDSCMSRMGIPDVLVALRKPGDNPERVTHDEKEFPVSLWQKWASPVWMDIDPSDTLQRTSAREHKDERHICPLQLEVIRRALFLWSNPGDIVISPFGGIASEGVVSLECGRKFVGIELKKSYWKQGLANLKIAESRKKVRKITDYI